AWRCVRACHDGAGCLSSHGDPVFSLGSAGHHRPATDRRRSVDALGGAGARAPAPAWPRLGRSVSPRPGSLHLRSRAPGNPLIVTAFVAVHRKALVRREDRKLWFTGAAVFAAIWIPLVWYTIGPGS